MRILRVVLHHRGIFPTETDRFFSICTEDNRKQYSLLGVLVSNSYGIRICKSLCLDMEKLSNICNDVFLHRVSTYQWFHITFCWQKCIIHESYVTWASRRLKLPVPQLFVQKIFRLRWNKNKATYYWPFLRESTSHRWIPWIPLTVRKAFT